MSLHTKPVVSVPFWHRLWTGSRLPFVLHRVHTGLMQIAPPVTIGVRMLIADSDGRVALIRHTYRPGWYLPGGGVKRWETLEQAAIREAREEAGVVVDRVTGPPSMHANFMRERSDHVALFTAATWSLDPTAVLSAEIAAVEFFPADAPPVGTTASTRRRLHEWLAGADPSDRW